MSRPAHTDRTTGRLDALTATPAVVSLADATPALLWRLATVAKALSISRRRLEQLRSAGEFPAPDKRIGSMPFWRPATIEAWIERGDD